MDTSPCHSINYDAWNIPLATNHWIIFKIIKLGTFHWSPNIGFLSTPLSLKHSIGHQTLDYFQSPQG
jgi:hypothetical protein